MSLKLFSMNFPADGRYGACAGVKAAEPCVWKAEYARQRQPVRAIAIRLND